MEVVAKSGNLELYDSGFLMAFEKKPIKLELRDEGDTLGIEFHFSENGNEKGTFDFFQESSTYLVCTFYNIQPNSPVGTLKPLYIGQITKNQQVVNHLYLAFIIDNIKDIGIKLEYMFYLSKEEI